MTLIPPLTGADDGTRLAAMNAVGAAAPGATAAPKAPFVAALESVPAPRSGVAPGAAAPSHAPSVGTAFEAATLTTFISHLLPSDDSLVWGGSAGKLWRGVFAEHLATEVAESGGVGIAEILDRMIAERIGDRS